MIKIDVINTVWEPGRFLLKDVAAKEKWQFENWIAEKYIEQIKATVNSQYYKTRLGRDGSPVWPPLSPKYLKWKKGKKYSTNIWEMKGETVGNLRYFKRGRRIGFDGRRKHTLTKQPYLRIARWVEYGTMRSVKSENKAGTKRIQILPPRPLFRKVYYNMRKSMKRLYNQYLKEQVRESE